MFLDLWSLAILTGDLLELIVNHIESGTLSVSLPFVLFLIVFGTISALAWRSTYIPDLPSAPRPPYVIQITGHQTIVNNNGQGSGNTLSDVRLLSNGADGETVYRRFSVPNQVTINLGSAGGTHHHHHHHLNLQNQTQSRAGNVRVQPQVQQPGQGQGGPSALLRLFRPGTGNPQLATRAAAAAAGAQTPNLIVYHRVNVYHHHHHHPVGASNTATSGASQQSQPLPSTPATSTSVDSFTQYETGDTLPGAEVMQNQSQPVEVPPTQDIETEEEDLLESESSEEVQASLSSQTHIPVPNEGLRHRTLRTNTETSSIFETDGGGTHIAGASGVMMESDNQSKRNDDQPNRPEPVMVEERVADIQFTIKFLNDTQMQVTTQPGENIADFKRRHFATEMSENKTVRLIFNGRVLDNDASTIRESGIFDQCVVHCLIVARSSMSPPSGTGGNASQNQSGRRSTGLIRAPEPGMFFVAFVGVFLIFLWFICFHFGQHLFTQSAVVSLTILTGIFLIGLVAFYLPVHPNQ